MPNKSIKGLRERRIELIHDIESKRQSKLITYVTSDRVNLSVHIAPDVVTIIHEHLIMNDIKSNDKVDLFIYSRGGDADVPWNLVSMFREYLKDGSFNVIIPYKAHSGATLISLGADEIIMTKKGELGPIDATIMNGPHNPIDPSNKQKRPISVEDVIGYFNLLKKISSKEEIKEIDVIEAFKELANKIDPLALGSVYRLLEQTELVARRLLETRNDKYEDDLNKRIANKLSSEIYSHRHSISRTEGKENLEIKHIVNCEDYNINEPVWNLYSCYSEFFSFDKPFMPEQYLIENELEEYTWKNLPLACIESNSRFDLCRKSVKVKKLRAIPNQVNLNISNLTLPQLVIPNQEGAMSPENIQRVMQQYFSQIIPNVINKTTEDVKNAFIKSLPDQGFQKVDLSGGWIQYK